MGTLPEHCWEREAGAGAGGVHNPPAAILMLRLTIMLTLGLAHTASGFAIIQPFCEGSKCIEVYDECRRLGGKTFSGFLGCVLPSDDFTVIAPFCKMSSSSSTCQNVPSISDPLGSGFDCSRNGGVSTHQGLGCVLPNPKKKTTTEAMAWIATIVSVFTLCVTVYLALALRKLTPLQNMGDTDASTGLGDERSSNALDTGLLPQHSQVATSSSSTGGATKIVSA